jgi:hypothetical protein
MKVNLKTVYSSIEATEEEVKFCRKLLEVAENVADKLGVNSEETLYSMIEDIGGHGYVDFNDYK